MRDAAGCTFPGNLPWEANFRAKHPHRALTHVPISPPHYYR